MKKMEPLLPGNKPIYFAVPGAKKYFNRFYSNHPHSFVHVSITGGSCALQCAHWRGKAAERYDTDEHSRQLNAADRWNDYPGFKG